MAPTTIFKTALAAAKRTPVARFAIKHAGALLMGGGVALDVTSTVLAARAGVKTAYILQDYNEAKELGLPDAKKAAAKLLVKTYIPCAVTEIAGVGLCVMSHKVEHGRLVAMTTAFNSLSAVANGAMAQHEASEQAEGAESVEIEKVDADSITVWKRPDGMSIFARCFDAANSNEWCRDMSANLALLQRVENWVCTMLVAGGPNGYVWLGDAFKQLGFKLDGCGYISMMGWHASDFLDEDGHVLEHPVSFNVYAPINEEVLDPTHPTGDLDGIWVDFPGVTAIWNRI